MTRARNSANLASHGNLFVDITNDRTGIGSVVPGQSLHVAGTAGFHADVTFTGDLYNTTWDRSDNSLKFVDNAKALFGTGSDLTIRHTGSASYIENSTGFLFIHSNDIALRSTAQENYIVCDANAEVEIYYDGSKKLETTAYGTNTTGTAVNDGLVVAGVATVTTMNVTGVLTYDDVTSVDSVGIITAREGVIIPDNKALSLGNRVVGSTAGDLRIYHDGSNSYIDEIGSGNLFIRNGTDTAIFCQTDGAVKLYNNGTERLATTHNSVSITGNLQVSQSITYGSQLQCNGDASFNGDSSKTILFDKSDGTFEFSDNARLRIGDGNHFQIFHNGTDTRFTNNQDHNIIKITSSEEVEIYKDQVKTVGITSFVDMPAPTGGQTMSHTGGRIRMRSNQTDDPVAMSLGMFAAPPSGDANVGLCTVILQSNSAKRPELRFDNIHNGNWHESNGNTQHLRIIWTAPNENSTTPEVCELKPIVANNASGTFSSFRIRTTDNSTGLKNVATFNTFGQNFYIDNSVSLQTSSNGLGVPDNLHHYLDTDTRIRFPQNDKITLEAGGTTRLQTISTGIQIDTILLLNGAAGNPGRLRLQEGGALCEIMVARNTDTSSFLYFKTEISGTTATRVVIDESGHLRPFTDSTYDLGITGTRWRNVYADTYYGNGANITNVDAATLDGVDGANYVRTNQNTTITSDLFIGGCGGGVTVNAGSDIRFTNGDWTGNVASGTAKIQHHANFLYIAGGSEGIIFRENNDNRWIIDGGGHFDPAADSAYDIGQSDKRVRNGYFDTLYGDGSNLTGISEVSVANQADNRLVTATGTTDALNAESALLFNGYELTFNVSGSQIILRGAGVTKHELLAHSSNNDLTFVNNRDSGNITSDIVFKGSGVGGETVKEKLRIKSNSVKITNLPSGYTAGALLINTDYTNFGHIIVRDKNNANAACLMAENENSGSDEMNRVYRSVNRNSGAWANAALCAKSHTFRISHDGASGDKAFIDTNGVRSNGTVSGTTCNSFRANTGFLSYGVFTARDQSTSNVHNAGFQVENPSTGSDTTNQFMRSVDLNSANWANAKYSAKAHRFLMNGSADTTKEHRITTDCNLITGRNDGNFTYNDTNATNNTISELYGGTSAGNRGILSLAGRTGSNNGLLGTIWFVNGNNSGTSPGANMRLAAAIQGHSYTTNGNSQGNSGGLLRFYTKTQGGSLTERFKISHDGHLIPNGNNNYDLGSSSSGWRNLYVNDAHFSNKGGSNSVDGTWGDWTLQEGENDIFMINNRTGKKFAITMREVS